MFHLVQQIDNGIDLPKALVGNLKVMEGTS